MKTSAGLRYMRTLTNRYVREVIDRLKTTYGREHPRAIIEAYAPEPGIIRIRITDPDFERQTPENREEPVWLVLESMGADFLQELHVLALVTPRERKRSPASRMFDEDMPRLARRNGKPTDKVMR